MDLLKDLFATVRKQQRAKKKPISITLSHSRPRTPVETIYSNPANWLPGRLVEVIHYPSGQRLGCFLEYTHTISPTARRLRPCPEGEGACTCREIVTGQHWIEPPRPAEPPEYSVEEKLRLKQRYLELDDLEVAQPRWLTL